MGRRPDRPVDLVYSNAALHWLPDHAALFTRLVACLPPGGVLAVQVPRNSEAPSHTLIDAAARDGPWREPLAPLTGQMPVREPAFYYQLLVPRVQQLDIWETEYLQVLEGDNPVADWTKGTWLRQFLAALEEPDRSAFEADYRRRVRAAYPPQPDGKTLFPFRRLFIVAVRKSVVGQ